VVKKCDLSKSITRLDSFFELLIFEDVKFAFDKNEEAGPNIIFIIDGIMELIGLIGCEFGVEHFFFNILEFSVAEVIEDEMVSEAAEDKVRICVIFFLEGDFDMFLDLGLDFAEVLIFELIVIVQMMRR
jgi:hypothetical protein